MTETEIQQLARITGVDERTVAAAFPAESVPGLIRTDAELDQVHERIRRGDAAEAELSYRALMHDHDPASLRRAASP